MATIPLPPDFSAFLKLLNEHEVKYLLVGGWAVGYYGEDSLSIIECDLALAEVYDKIEMPA